MKRITRYILQEIFPFFIIGNLFFVFILLLQQIVQLADFVFVRSVGFLSIAQTIVYFLPSFLVITIPISTLLAVLLAFNRFSADSELIAMRASGANHFVFIFPTLMFGILTALLAAYFSTVLAAKGSELAMNNLNKMLENVSISNIKEKEMYEDLGGMIFYANKKIDNSHFEGLIVINTNDKSIISAQKGTIIPNSNRSLMMQFEGGKYTMTDYQNTYTSLEFGKMSLNMPLNLNIELLPMSERFMSMADLRKNFPNGSLYRFEYTKRFSMAISAIIMALLGLSLGIFLHRSGRSVGIVLSCAIALVFNVLFIIGENLAAGGTSHPVLLAWAPNIIFAIILIPMLRKAL